MRNIYLFNFELEVCTNNFPSFYSNIYTWNIFWVHSASSWTLMDFLAELVDHKFEATWFIMSWKIPNEILVLAVNALCRIKYYIFNLIFMVCLLVYIQSHVICWIFVHIKAHILKFSVFKLLRFIIVWKLAMNIKVNLVIPRQAETYRVVIGNFTASLSHSLFGESTVFSLGIWVSLVSIFPIVSCFLFKFFEKCLNNKVFVWIDDIIVLPFISYPTPVLH